ncbi:hypothetical protein [Micromonospora sp. WMMD980]|uniref:hypothetical protein n=1 Tax=Micromonospora sp. WMMD980 TaxID=3016088 RepID=UPI002417F091|nr:hypothetical protein [Micromonospora sp. WMMD980]MDG4803867.1 hypothetical protein [Micromonospora sp. WMMD980]
MRSHHRLARRLPARAIDAAAYLQAFVLSGVVTVLAVRAYLRATDYPQLGGGGLGARCSASAPPRWSPPC